MFRARPEGAGHQINNAKAMMGRVSGEIRHREPGQLETGTEGPAEHGLGAARLRDIRVLRPRRARPSQRQGMSVPGKARPREGRVKQGGTTKRPSRSRP